MLIPSRRLETPLLPEVWVPNAPRAATCCPVALTLGTRFPRFVGPWAQALGYPCQLSLGDDTLSNADLVDCRVDRVWGTIKVCTTGRDPCLFLEASPRFQSEVLLPCHVDQQYSIYLFHLSFGLNEVATAVAEQTIIIHSLKRAYTRLTRSGRTAASLSTLSSKSLSGVTPDSTKLHFALRVLRHSTLLSSSQHIQRQVAPQVRRGLPVLALLLRKVRKQLFSDRHWSPIVRLHAS